MIKMGKSKKNPVILNENEIDSTLVDLNSLALAIPQSQEVEEKVQLISEIESLAEINKQALAARRQTVEIEVEGKKLETAMKTIDSIDKIISAVSSEEVLERVIKKIKTPMDMKMMAEAAERLTNTLKNLMNPNTLDGYGTKKKQKINFMFKSNGPIQAAVQIDNSDD
jgi:hypothetical protein